MSRRATRSVARILEQSTYLEDVNRVIGRHVFTGSAKKHDTNVSVAIDGFGKVLSISGKVSNAEQTALLNAALYNAHIASVEAKQRAYKSLGPKIGHTSQDIQPFALAHSVFPSPVSAYLTSTSTPLGGDSLPVHLATNASPSRRAHTAVLRHLQDAGAALRNSKYAVAPHVHPPRFSIADGPSLPGTAAPPSEPSLPDAMRPLPTHQRDVQVAALLAAMLRNLARCANQGSGGAPSDVSTVNSAVDAFVADASRMPGVIASGIDSAPPRAGASSGKATVAAAVADVMLRDVGTGLAVHSEFRGMATSAENDAVNDVAKVQGQ